MKNRSGRGEPRGEEPSWLLVMADGEAPRVLKTPLEGKMCALVPESGKRPCCWPIPEDTVLVVPSPAELELAPAVLVDLTSARHDNRSN